MTSGQTTPQIKNKLESIFFSVQQPDSKKVTLLFVEIIKEWMNKYILLDVIWETFTWPIDFNIAI